MWSCGDQIVLRYRTAGRLAWVGAVTVVEDSAECIAFYLAVGTPILQPVHLDGSPIPRAIPYEERYRLEWRLGEGVWHSTARLFVVRPGAAHAFSAFWQGDDWTFLGWYVDLQAPYARTDDGFESEDYVLDLLIDPDGSWRWKDEDEFAAAQRVGRFSAEQASAIRAEGAAVVEAIESRRWPLDAGWEAWRPDPSWVVPRLPMGSASFLLKASLRNRCSRDGERG
jgi:uncharacterized protein